MIVDPPSRTRPSPEIPLALRAALDLMAVESGCRDGSIRGRIIGREPLVNELARYAPTLTGGNILIVLGAEPVEVSRVVATSRPERVLSVMDGPLARLRHGWRGAAVTAMSDLDRGAWRALGYQLAGTWGFQGSGAIAWALAERLMRWIARPDLADRCRIGMLRTVVAARLVPQLVTVRVRAYRRIG